MNDTLRHGAAFAPDLTGEPYWAVLERLHRFLNPRTYFEIGTLDGQTLRLARCASVAVDPQFLIHDNVAEGKPFLCLHQISSDDFFREHNPTIIFGRKIDLAFLDGLHLFEFLLRDFLNTERHCRNNSIIVMHDCIPTDIYMAARQKDVANELRPQHEGWWTGDVWKVVPILSKYRPELLIHAVDAAPTGLVLVTNLDSCSDVLERGYFHIVAEFEDLSLQEYGINTYVDELQMISTQRLQTPQGSPHFGAAIYGERESDGRCRVYEKTRTDRPDVRKAMSR
jgi:hypothetical protein